MEKSNAKLLVFTKFYWPEGGGAELATHLILNMLSKEFDIAIVSGTPRSKAEISYEISKYIHWRSLKFNYKPLELLNHLFLNATIRNSIVEADSIYVHSPLPVTIFARKHNPEARIVAHLHNYQPISYTSVMFHDATTNDLARSIRLELFENKSIRRALLSGAFSCTNIINRIALSYADKVICVSNKHAEIISSEVEEIKDKLTVIYNPIPQYTKNEKVPSERPTMLYLGGESYIKGFHLLLKAIPKLPLGLIGGDQIICAGEFGLHNSYPQFPAVKIVGMIDHQVVHELYRKSWILLGPSIAEEPMPYTIVEAMATGTVPVASSVGGIPEIVQGTYAEKTLFTPGNIDEFVEKIEEVSCLSRDELIDIGAELRYNINKKFDNEVTKRRFLENFEK